MWTIPPPVKHARMVALTLLAIAGSAGPVAAHVSEMGLVLLLPTEFYMQAGVWAVALTLAALALSPAAVIERGFAALPLARLPVIPPTLTSIVSAAILLALIALGLNGSRDPLSNPLPLMIWIVWWVGLVLAQAIIGDIWHWLNPWTGLHRVLAGQGAAPLRLPKGMGMWPGLAVLILFTIFALADPAPDDPARLALIVGCYWAVVLAGVMLFGPAFLRQCDFVTALMAVLARHAPLGIVRGSLRVGLPGWQILAGGWSVSAAAFVLTFLAIGSFDGLNETFWWLGLIGVNPLEFPGRSAIIGETIGGLIAAIVLLFVIFLAAVAFGLRLVRSNVSLAAAFKALAPTILPIGVAYHFAHYLTATMVNGQYALAAATDPMATGADWLGLGVVQVTTGFLNTPDSVERIFQAQAGAVVAGHVLSVILSHAAAMRLFGSRRNATISQLPLAIFMIAYTFIGLWLLAAPKGA